MERISKLLLIGWDAADWKAINPLMDAGKMPNLQRLVNEGTMGNIATLNPPLSPMLWTSISTGKRPYKHGIHGFSEPDPVTGGVRPITILSRKTKAVWNILSQQGKRCNVVGWWPSHPAEPINGAMVSNHFQRIHAPADKPWPMQRGTVHPDELSPQLSRMRLHPAEVDPDILRLFVPDAAKIDQEKDKRLVSLSKIIADSAGVHNAATFLMQREPWDFMAVYYDAIDHFGHGFMQYHPPRRDWIKEEDFAIYSGVIEAAYRYHDLMLGVLLKLAGEDATVIVMSDHGFHPDNLRPRHIPAEPAGPAVEHSPYGIFVIKGPGIRKDERLFGASLLDVTPTILHHFQLPVGADMDGKVLAYAWENAGEIETIPSWDDVPGADGRHPASTEIDPEAASQSLRQLVALGYIEEPSEDKSVAVAESVRELRYNKARSLVDGGQWLAASEIFANLWNDWPGEHRFGVAYFQSLLAQVRIPEARTAFEKLVALKKKYAGEAMLKLRDWKEANKDRKPEKLTQKENYEMRRLRSQSSTNRSALAFMESSLLYHEGKYAESLAIIRAFAKKADSGARSEVFLQCGRALIKLRKFREALERFHEALAIDPNLSDAHSGMALCHLRLRQNRAAAEHALAAIGLIYCQPHVHHMLGMALHRLGDATMAARALEVAISQNPYQPSAHLRLARIHRDLLQDQEKSRHHLELAARARILVREARQNRNRPTQTVALAAEPGQLEAGPTQPLSLIFGAPLTAAPCVREETIFVVSGLPRSGTSMLMQMLVAGGIPSLTDGERLPDPDNPRGYHEMERVKSLHRDASWLASTGRGHAVKVIAQLLPSLPRAASYRILFIHRNIDEVIASQKKMLERLGRKGAQISDQELKTAYQQQVVTARSAAASLPATEVLDVRYQDLLENPTASAAKIAVFLGGGLDTDAMAAAIDPQLYRQRKSAVPN